VLTVDAVSSLWRVRALWGPVTFDKTLARLALSL